MNEMKKEENTREKKRVKKKTDGNQRVKRSKRQVVWNQ